MKRYMTPLLVLLMTGGTVLAGMALWPAEAAALPKPKFVDENTKYLQRYVSVHDVWAGWVPREDGFGNVHIATGRIVNSGKRNIIITDARIALLNVNGNVIQEKQILSYPERQPWQPQIEPGKAAGFYEFLPPTDGMPPVEWTGEILVSVTSITML